MNVRAVSGNRSKVSTGPGRILPVNLHSQDGPSLLDAEKQRNSAFISVIQARLSCGPLYTPGWEQYCAVAYVNGDLDTYGGPDVLGMPKVSNKFGLLTVGFTGRVAVRGDRKTEEVLAVYTPVHVLDASSKYVAVTGHPQVRCFHPPSEAPHQFPYYPPFHLEQEWRWAHSAACLLMQLTHTLATTHGEPSADPSAQVRAPFLAIERVDDSGVESYAAVTDSTAPALNADGSVDRSKYFYDFSNVPTGIDRRRHSTAVPTSLHWMIQRAHVRCPNQQLGDIKWQYAV